MPVATASREAYGRMRSVPPKEHPVYKFLKAVGTGTAGYSNRQIAAIMGRPINTITPRIFELRQAGVVVLAGKRKDLYSGVTVSHWRIATEAEENAHKGIYLTLKDIPAGLYEAPDTTSEGGHLLVRSNGQDQTAFSYSDGKVWTPFQGYFHGEDEMFAPFTRIGD